jgi:hypothetical protein
MRTDITLRGSQKPIQTGRLAKRKASNASWRLFIQLYVASSGDHDILPAVELIRHRRGAPSLPSYNCWASRASIMIDGASFGSR